MQSIPLIACLTTVTCLACAQQQERRLVDRLLRPDMSLVNKAQDKKFVTGEKISIDKQLDPRMFQSSDPHPLKSFLGIREFFTHAFAAKRSSQTGMVAVARGESRYARTNFATSKSSFAGASHAAENKVRARDYVESQRPFLGKGTRQKILSQQSHTLTIDEVRELLNKND